MIFVRKNIDHVPTTLTSPNCVNHYVQIVNPAHAEFRNAKQIYYGASDVVTKLKAIYNNKCAYCESYEDQPEVEHYRPKKRVSGVDTNVHSGYYWLAYEWTNLLPACHDCNKTGVKGNHFPVDLNYKTIPGPNVNDSKLQSAYLLIDECPLFLNPEVNGFNPFDYFLFDDFGLMKEKAHVGTLQFRQAQKTIEIVDLNRAKLFLIFRKKEIREFHKAIKFLLYQFLKGDINHNGLKEQIHTMLDKIRVSSNPRKPYSFFWQYFYQNVTRFVNKAIKPKYRHLFYDLITEYKNNH